MSSPPPDRAHLLDALRRELGRVSAQSVLFSQAVADRLGMHPTDLECLDILRDAGPITAGRLAELAGLTTGAITGVVDRLERAGYVRRESDPADRRRVIIRLVPERAADTIAPLYAPLSRALDDLFSRYSDQDLALILDFAARSNAIVKAETVRLRQEAGTRHPLAPPFELASEGRLVFASGAAQVTIRADPSLVEPCRPGGDAPPPDIRVRGNTVTVRYGGFPFNWGRRAAEVVLNGSIPWQVELRGGVSQLTADLRELPLRSLEVSGGASRVAVTLPRPVGAVPIRVTGGASHLTIRRPAGVAVEIHVTGGASGLSLDGEPLEHRGGEGRWTSRDAASGTGRYELEISGGASTVAVDTW